MIKKFKPKSDFSRNVVTLLTGTTIAQIIPVAITPILTRIYSPEEFGIFAMYVALISTGAVMATGRLEMAILLPKKSNDARLLLLLTLLLAATISFSIFVIMVAVDIVGMNYSYYRGIEACFYLVPFSIFLFAAYAGFLAWLNREKQYSKMSKSRVVQASSISLLQVAVGNISKHGSGLIVADVIGRIIAIIIISRQIEIKFNDVSFNKIKKIALLRRYQKFPKYEMPASLLNVSAYQAPYMIIPIIFSSALAGLYFLVYRVLMLPVSLIGTAVLEVFRNRATEDYIRTGSCRKIYIKTMKLLFLLGLPPIIILGLFGQEIFVFIFGSRWQGAGLYAQILAPMALFRFVSAPLSYLFILREKLELDLLMQGGFMAMVGLSLFTAWYLESDVLMVALLSLSGCLFYSIQILCSYKLSNGDL